MFRSISMDFTPTPTVPSASNTLYPASIFCSSQVEPGKFNKKLNKTPTGALRPINPDNAWGFCLTAAAGTEFASPYSYHTFSLATYSGRKEFYNPKAVFTHAASLGQGFPHCRIFSTAASRRSMSHVSVSLLGNKLSLPLPVIALVGHYPTN